MSFWFELIIIFVLVLLNGLFSASEIAIVSTRRTRIKDLIEKGKTRAKIVEKLQSDPDTFLATVQIGITVVGSFASALGGTAAIQYLKEPIQQLNIPFISEQSEFAALLLVVALITYLSLTIGELIPKSLALRYSEKFSLFIAPFILLLSKLFSPAVKILVGTSNLLLKPFHDHTTFSESKISEEEFRIMIDEGSKTGVIDKTEHELISNIFEFTETTVKEIMVPRTDVVAVEINASKEKIMSIVAEEGYSRMPVYQENVDNILGIVYSKDLIPLIEHEAIILHDIIRSAYFIPQTKKISVLLREMQRQKIHIAIVNDEYGGTAGIITMEEIIEEIVGEIHDEYDEELKEIETASDGSFLVNAKISISNFNERFGSAIPEDAEYDTLSGFIQKLSGKIPELKEEIRYDGWTFSVVKKSQRRIRQVQAKKVASPDINV
ncbi:MAG: HlyC/CorC family transporter [Ignavibacteriales bacterium]|nr:HlyC/CorC family transporter [Ignavibacteriales bacterium]